MLTTDLAEELVGRLAHLPYHAYEECLRELLHTLGYADARILKRRQWRRLEPGGFDLAAESATGVTSATVVVQAKQYLRPVGRRFVDELRGAMLRTGARHGLVVTLSGFSQAARAAALRETVGPIRLMDGPELATLLARHSLGVAATAGFPAIDEGYFAELAARFPGRPRRHRPRDGAGAPGEALEIPITRGGEMMFRTHALGAISSLWAFALLPGGIPTLDVGYLAVVAVLGAMLPDLDAAASTIRSLSLGGIQPFALPATALHRTFGHRGFLHSLGALFVLGSAATVLARWWGWQPALALWLGYASHLLLDACTRSGVPLFLPSGRRLYLLPRPLRVRTGSQGEDLVFPWLVGAVFLLILTHLPPA